MKISLMYIDFVFILPAFTNNTSVGGLYLKLNLLEVPYVCVKLTIFYPYAST